MFYVLTGKQDKLKILQEALHLQGENSRRFLNSIYTNNVDEKIKILTETGHLSLALLAARVHKKSEYVETIIENTKAIGKEIVLNEDDVRDIESKVKASVPLKSIFSIRNKSYHGDWVTHTELKKGTQSNLDNILNQKEDESNDTTISDGGFKFEGKVEEVQPQVNKTEQKKKIESKWNDEEEDDDEEIKKILEEKSKNAQNVIQSLTIGEDDSIYRNYVNSSIPGVQVALGNFKITFNYLKSQLGIMGQTIYESLRPVIKNIYMSSYAQINFIPCLPVNEMQLRQTKNGVIFPQNGITLKSLSDMLESGYALVTENNMPDALIIFKNILKYAIFYIAIEKSEDTRVREIISICAEYIYLTRLCILADENKADKVKYAELCCIMANCKLEGSIHKFLIFRKAKVACKNIKNFISALVFIKKMMVFEKEVKFININF
jgi:coatomer protein complex subunit alpha (xenin)